MSDHPAAELAGHQPVEVVDRHGQVVEVVTRRRMRAGNLRHRCTYVVVVVGPADLVAGAPSPGLLPADTPVVVHKRAAWKDTSPSHWDLAFGGVCDVGEDWSRSAARELEEEAGIAGAVLIDLGPVSYDDERTSVLGRVYLTAWPDPPVCNDGEVVALDQVPLGGLAAWLASVPVCQDSATVVPPLLFPLIGGPNR